MELRPLLEWLRVRTIHRLGGVMPERGLKYDELIQLLYPNLVDDAARQLLADVGSGELSDRATIRSILGVLENQLTPSSFMVLMSDRDVGIANVEGIEMYYDKADQSVSQQIRQGIYEPHITALFKRICKPGMTVVDLGANIGYYSFLASGLVGGEGKVIAVEPSSENCRMLLSSVHLDPVRTNIRLLPLACDRKIGWAYYSKHIGSNGGLVDPNDLLSRPGTVVPVFPLESIISEPVHLMKLDVEGAEYRVMSGARAILDRDRPVIVSEISRDMLDRVSCVTAEDYLGLFDEFGYDGSVIDRSTWELITFESLSDLGKSLEDRYQIENILLTPNE